MKSPFPGMNPYLETRWGDVHSRLNIYASDVLSRSLPPGFLARSEERAIFSETERNRRTEEEQKKNRRRTEEEQKKNRRRTEEEQKKNRRRTEEEQKKNRRRTEEEQKKNRRRTEEEQKKNRRRTEEEQKKNRRRTEEEQKVPPTLLLTAASGMGRFVAQGDTK